jgi:opacity protein-like surface antigen
MTVACGGHYGSEAMGPAPNDNAVARHKPVFLSCVTAIVMAVGSVWSVSAAQAQNYDIYIAGDGLRFGVFGQVGLANLKIENDTLNRTSDIGGANARFGVSLGYDWRFQNTLVFGVEADTAIGNASSKHDQYTFANDYFVSFRGRLGYYATPDVLVYGTAGYALTGVEYKPTTGPFANSNAASVAKISSTLSGATIGFGAEYDYYGMRLFSEYLFSGYEKWGFRSFGSNAGDHLSVLETSHQFRLGVKFNLNPEYNVRPFR